MKYQTQLIRTAAAFILYVLLTATFLPSSAQTTIRRVTTMGTGNGSTWATASSLQTALGASMAGDQVWIAQGTYKPDATDRTATFSVPAGVLVYGGFAGSEAALANRTGGATILSGDLLGDDGTRPVRPPATDDQAAYNAALVTYNAALVTYNATRDDNSRTVVTIGGANVTLNGLTIEGGERGTADITFRTRSHGAGLFAGVGTTGTTLTACTFNNNNSGYWGGGAYFDGAATLTGCDFNNNSADNGGGGAFFRGTATVTNCTFTENTTNGNGFVSGGGGAYFDGAATLTGCDFNDNNSNNLGGGAYFRGTATVTNCTFTENTANNDGGGALFLGTTTVTQCTFTENTANNRSSDGGGAYFDGVSTVINSTLYNNNAGGIGGGIATTSAFPFILQNSILIGNTARVAAFGHQIRVFNTDAARIVNIQNNLIAGGADPLGTNQGVVYSNSGPANITEANTVDESDATVVFASTDAMNANYLRLRVGSPAVNAGNNLYLNNGTPDDTNDDIKIDAAGNARIQNRRVDLGAYESTLDAPPTQAITFADPTGGVGVIVGQSIDLVATTDALDLFVTFTTDPPGIATLLDDGTGDGMGRLRFDAIGVVTVTAVQAGGDSEGVTYPPATSVTYTITVRPTAGATIFRVAETATGIENGSSWANVMTLQAALGIAIVAGDQIWIAAGTYTPHADDRAGTFTIPAGVLVYGGFDPVADASDTDASSRSGAATILSGDLSDDDLTDREDANYTLRRTDNSRTVVTIGGANVTLNGLTIEGGERGTAVINSDTSHHGAGLFAGVGTTGTTLTACAFNNNSADDDGGGAYFYGAATLTGCDFNNNSADGDGGGAFFRRTATVTNCTFTENTANGRLSNGGGAYFGGVSTVINSTLYNNNAYIRGGGLYVNNLAFPFILQNSILIGNTAAGAAFGHQISVFNIDAARIVNIQNNLIAGGADPLDQGVYSTSGSPNITEANTVDESDATVVFVSTDAMNANYLRLRVGSPALNAGNNLYLNNGTPGDTNDDIKIDAAGNARIQGDTVDLGAYEGAVAAPMAQAIAFTSDDTGAVGDDITLAATGGASGLDVTFEIATETLPDGSAATTGEVATLGDDGTTLTLTGVGTVDITATQSGNANYTMATQTQTITVSQGTQAIAFTSDDTGAVGDDITLAATGGASGLDVTFEITTETLPDGSAATTGEVATLGDDGTTLTLTGVGTVGITATQSGNANYAAATQTQTITVSQGTQTIEFTPPAGGSVGTDIELMATASSGLDVTFAVTLGGTGTASLESNGTTLTLTGVGTVDITATQSGNANYTMATQTQTITVSQGTQAIAFTSDDTGAVGDDITLAATGGASGLDVTFEITTETLLDGSAATTGEVATLGDDGTTLTLTGVGTVDITATQSGNANYAAATQTQTITVSQGTQAIAFTSADTGAVGDDITLAATGGASGLDVTFEITTETLLDGSAATTGEVATLGDDGTTLTLTGVGTVDITATQSGNANYTMATQTQTITVSQGAQAIAFTSDDTGAVGDDITLAATGGASGLDVTFEITTETLPDGSAATTGEVATLGDDGTTLTLTGVGTVDITATQSGNANYTMATQTQTITVSQGTQTIEFTPPAGGSVGTDIELMATASSGLDVTFAVTLGGTGTATLESNGTTLTLTGVGMVDITATQSGNANYTMATQTQTITVSQGKQTITFTSDTTGNVGTNIELAATASSTLPVTFEITGGTGTATLSNNTLSLTGVGTVDITATQAGNANYAAATQTQTIMVDVALNIRRVTTAGTGDGSTWAVAMNLEAALAASTTPGNQIWIAQGTYKPHATDRTVSFRIPTGVLVYGGFAGTEATFDPTTNDTRARNAEGVLTNVTILSGDLLGDDGTRPVRPPATADTADQTAYNAALATYTATRDDNSNTVVILAGENVTLDGLTISGGQGGNRADFSRGAGLSAGTGTAGATLTGCTFTGNEATSNGGGAFFTGATLTNCTFTSNMSGNHGGGVFGIGATLTACTFTNNIADNGGGGAYFSTTGPATLTNCTFTGNEASGAGGAQLSGGGTLTACTFTGNTARFSNGGGAIFKKGGELRNCVFANNTSTNNTSNGIVGGGRGGGLSITSGATIINSTFYANTSTGQGGGMYVDFGLTGSFTLRNNVLIGNTATKLGNQVFVSNTAANIVNIQTNLIEGEAAPSGTDQGVRYGIPGSSNITEENTVDEDDVDVVFASTDAMNENYLRLTAGSPAVNLGNNDYLNNGTPGNPNDDITLDAAGAARIQRGVVDLGAYESDIKGAQTITFTSPAIGVVGTDIELVATASSGLDVTFEITGGTGTATLSNNTLSLTGVGKVEVTATQVGNENYAMTTQTQTITVRPVVAVIFRVTMTGAGDRDGSSWRNAMTLQAALAAPTVTGDQIWIAQGTYKPHADDRTATFSVPAGVLVYGGFAGTEATFDPTTNDTRARNTEGVLTNVTILSGDLTGDDGTRPVRPPAADDQTAYNAALATYNATRDDNSNTVVILAGENVTLDGLTISGGQGGNRADHNRGAGLSAGAAGATLTGCTFTGNEATSNGGGAFFDATGVTLTNCTFTSNKSGNRGGGVFGKGVTLTACTFTNNIAGGGGGGAYFSDSAGGATSQLTNCTFTGNTARFGNGGGAIFRKGGELRNCVFANNTSNSSGGGLSITSGATIINSTFYANTSAGQGGGMYVAFGLQTSPFTLRNNVLIGNTATMLGNQVFVSNTAANIVNIQTNLIEGEAAPRGTDQGVRYEFPGSSNITEENTVDEDDVDVVFASTDAMNENYLRLTAGSPAVNLGNNDYLNNGTPGNPNDDITLDAAGAARIQRGAVDLGAYESDIKGAQTISFADSATGGPVGTDIVLVVVVEGGDSGEPVTFAITEGDTLATLADNTLSLTGVGTVIITATQSGNENYEAATPVTHEITVSQGTQTITFTSDTTGNVGTEIELEATGGASGQPVTFEITPGGTGTASLDDNGTTLTLTGVGTVEITATQMGNANYADTMQTQTITVSQGTQTITFTSDTTGNVGTNIELAATASSGLPVTFAITPGGTGTASLDDNGTTLTLTGVGTVEITATQAGDANYAEATETQTITVSQGRQTITFTSDTTGNVGANIELAATASSTLPVTFEITTGDTLATLLDSTLSLTGVGTVIITATQAGDANYAEATETQTITVSQGRQTITFTSDTTGNVGTNIELAATASSGLPVTFAITEGDTLATLVDSTLSLTGIGTVTITATQEGNANYADTMQTQTITVSQGTQTITFTSDTTGNVGTNIELAATASSTLPVTFAITEGDTLVTLADNTLSLTGVGTVTITATQEGNANYADTMQTQTITVSQGTQTITFTSDTTGNVGTNIELAATASSGLPVTFAITEGDTLATLADNTLSLTGVGTVTITATQEGNANYADTMQTQTITVSQETQTITFTSDTTGNVGTEIELAATASSGLPVTFAITEGDTLATLVDSTLSLTGVGTVTITATQEGNANYADTMQTQTITVSQRTQTITFTSDTTGNVGTEIELAATASSGLPVTFAITEGDTLATLVDSTLSLTGVGTVTITATQEGNANYADTMQTQTIMVSQGTQTITFTSDTTGNVGTEIELAATASSTLPVTFEITTNPTAGVATLTDDGTGDGMGSLTLTGAGTITVTASQAGNADYAAATPVERTITVEAKTALGIEEVVDDLVLYPNPTSGKLYFSEQVEEFLLYSSEGRLLDTWKNVRSADLTALPSGMYFVEVIRGGRSVGYRIVRK